MDEEEEEKRSDDDDEVALRKARQFDEYKDGVFLYACRHAPYMSAYLCFPSDHRRGSGNRHGKG